MQPSPLPHRDWDSCRVQPRQSSAHRAGSWTQLLISRQKAQCWVSTLEHRNQWHVSGWWVLFHDPPKLVSQSAAFLCAVAARAFYWTHSMLVFADAFDSQVRKYLQALFKLIISQAAKHRIPRDNLTVPTGDGDYRYTDVTCGYATDALWLRVKCYTAAPWYIRMILTVLPFFIPSVWLQKVFSTALLSLFRGLYCN